MDAKFFIGAPFLFKNSCYIYPPLVKDVVNDPLYSFYCQILTRSQEDIWDVIAEEYNMLEVGVFFNEDGFMEYETPTNAVTPFEDLLAACDSDQGFTKIVAKSISFFTKEEVKIIPSEKKIIFVGSILNADDVKDLRFIEEEDYFDFQNLIRDVIGENRKKRPQIDEDPRYARMKAMARKRDAIKNKQKGDKISLSTLLAGVCCMNVGLNPLNIGEATYPSVKLLADIGRQKEAYDHSMNLMASGMITKKNKINTKHWIRNVKTD